MGKIGVIVTEYDGDASPPDIQQLPVVTDFNHAKYILCNFGIPIICADFDGVRPPQTVINLKQAEEFYNSYPHQENKESLEKSN